MYCIWRSVLKGGHVEPVLFDQQEMWRALSLEKHKPPRVVCVFFPKGTSPKTPNEASNDQGCVEFLLVHQCLIGKQLINQAYRNNFFLHYTSSNRKEIKRTPNTVLWVNKSTYVYIYIYTHYNRSICITTHFHMRWFSGPGQNLWLGRTSFVGKQLGSEPPLSTSVVSVTTPQIHCSTWLTTAHCWQIAGVTTGTGAAPRTMEFPAVQPAPADLSHWSMGNPMKTSVNVRNMDDDSW